MLDQKKIDSLAGKLFELMLGDENSEATSMSAGIQALCMVAAFHSKSFDDLAPKMEKAIEFAGAYLQANREAYEQTMEAAKEPLQ